MYGLNSSSFLSR